MFECKLMERDNKSGKLNRKGEVSVEIRGWKRKGGEGGDRNERKEVMRGEMARRRKSV